jgi:hypothetical protein
MKPGYFFKKMFNLEFKNNKIKFKNNKKPHFYYMDLNNYNDDFLRKIILWQKDKIEELNKKEID